MSTETTNLALIKDDPTDFYSIERVNQNLDKIDAVVAAKETPAGAQSKANTAETNAKVYTDALIAALVDSSPAALNTLNELAAALGDDPNFATTVLNQIAVKADASALASHQADYVRQPGYGITAGSANTYTLTLNPVLTAYTAGVCVAVKIHAANTGASTININGLGVKTIIDSKGSALTSGKLKLNIIYTLRYDGTNFILQGEGGFGNATASDLLSGKTASVDAGDIVGTMFAYAKDGAGVVTTAPTVVNTYTGFVDMYYPTAGYIPGNCYFRGTIDNLDPAYIKKGISVGTGTGAKVVGSYDAITPNTSSSNTVTAGEALAIGDLLEFNSSKAIKCVTKELSLVSDAVATSTGTGNQLGAASCSIGTNRIFNASGNAGSGVYANISTINADGSITNTSLVKLSNNYVIYGMQCLQLAEDKVLIIYRDSNTTYETYYQVVTTTSNNIVSVSGQITLGTYYGNAKLISSTKLAMVWSGNGIRVAVWDISNNTLINANSTLLDSAYGEAPDVTLIDTDKLLCVYTYNYIMYAVAMTISGTTATKGTTITVSTNAVYPCIASHTTNKAMTFSAYKDVYNPVSHILTVSGTTVTVASQKLIPFKTQTGLVIQYGNIIQKYGASSFIAYSGSASEVYLIEMTGDNITKVSNYMLPLDLYYTYNSNSIVEYGSNRCFVIGTENSTKNIRYYNIGYLLKPSGIAKTAAALNQSVDIFRFN